MGLIKATDVPLGVSAFSMQDIEAAARIGASPAPGKADQIIAGARRSRNRSSSGRKPKGWPKGVSRGGARGLRKAGNRGTPQALAQNSEAMKQLINSLTEACRDLDDGRDQLHTHAISEVVGLASAIARKVISAGRRISMIRFCAEFEGGAVAGGSRCRRANRGESGAAQDASGRDSKSAPGVAAIETHRTGGRCGTSPGGARVFTAQGQIDADVDVQLDRIIADLLPEMRGGEVDLSRLAS